MRGVVFRFESFDALSLLMEAGGDEQELELPCQEGLRESEWLLVTVAVGEESVDVAAYVMDHGYGLRLVFEDRDWKQLWRFANAAGPPSLPPSSVQSTPVPLEAPPGAKVLVVDDEPDVLTVVAATLKANGFGVISVGSAEEAYAHIVRHTVDLIVLDWSLPGMSGLELCKKLRGEALHRRVPVLFLTSHTSSQDLVRAFAAGADDFVSKPFRAPELGARALGLLRRVRFGSSPCP